MTVLELNIFFDDLLENCKDPESLHMVVEKIVVALNSAISDVALDNEFETDCEVYFE